MYCVSGDKSLNSDRKAKKQQSASGLGSRDLKLTLGYVPAAFINHSG